MTIALNARPSKSGLLDRIQAPNVAAIVIGLLSAGSIALLSQGMCFPATLMVFMGCYIYPTKLWALQDQFKSKLRAWKINPNLFMGAILGLLAGVLLLSMYMEPAQAQFFGNAETFFLKLGVDATMTALIVNVVRALFILYLLFGLVQVINAARQGEEWKDLAKTPFLVMMAGSIGDLLIGQIGGP